MLKCFLNTPVHYLLSAAAGCGLKEHVLPHVQSNTFTLLVRSASVFPSSLHDSPGCRFIFNDRPCSVTQRPD